MGGKLTDMAGRKKLMLGMQCLAALCVLSCGFIPDSPAVAWLLLVFTFFNGAVRPINTALLTDLTTVEQRGPAYSLLYLGINIGVSAGPILAGFLFNHYRQWIFWGDALTTAFTILLILLFIKEPEHQDKLLSEQEKHVEGYSLKALYNIPILFRFAGLTVLSAFIYSQHNFTLPLQLLQNFEDRGPKLYGFIMSFNAVSVLVLTPWFNHMMRKRKPLHRIAIGQILYAVGFGILFFDIPHPMWYFLSTLLWTAGEVLDATNSGVFVANNSPVNHRGRFNSIFLVTKGGGRALAPLISGYVLEHLGIRYMWSFIFVLGVILYFFIRNMDGLSSGKS